MSEDVFNESLLLKSGNLPLMVLNRPCFHSEEGFLIFLTLTWLNNYKFKEVRHWRKRITCFDATENISAGLNLGSDSLTGVAKCQNETYGLDATQQL